MRKPKKTLYMSVLMTPDMANFSGNVHGGAILKLLDQVAYACAAQYARSYVVTASLDQMFFKLPVKVGEMVTFNANINFTGRCSMEVGIKVVAEDLQSQVRRHTNSCYFTMVAKNEDGTSREIPPLVPETELEEKLFEAGKMRRKMRAEIEQRNRELHVGIPDDEILDDSYQVI